MKLTHTLLLSTLFIGSQSALANIDIVFDYSYDGSGFFTGANSSRQNVLESAASVFETRFEDSLSAITSSGGNQFRADFSNPSNGATTSISGYSVGADQIVVFVGAYDLGSSTLGVGGPGGFSASGSADFLDTVASRGQPGALATPATDFGPWGGSLSFDSDSSRIFPDQPAHSRQGNHSHRMPAILGRLWKKNRIGGIAAFLSYTTPLGYP